MVQRALTPETLDIIHSRAWKHADILISQNGFIVSSVYPIDENGCQPFSLLTGPEDHEIQVNPQDAVIVLPAPLSAHQVMITSMFRQFNVVAATWLGEVWMYPPDRADELMDEFLCGVGEPPSNHPDRREAAVACTVWPQGGYTNLTVEHIMRGPEGAYLNPVSSNQHNPSFRQVAPGQRKPHRHDVSAFVSWLDDCLPS